MIFSPSENNSWFYLFLFISWKRSGNKIDHFETGENKKSLSQYLDEYIGQVDSLVAVGVFPSGASLIIRFGSSKGVVPTFDESCKVCAHEVSRQLACYVSLLNLLLKKYWKQ